MGAVCWAAFMLCGCTGTVENQESVFLMRTDKLSISCLDFSEELDLKRAAYPYSIKSKPVEYNEMVMNLVNMLSEELVLLNAAADKGIVIGEKELETAVNEFKKDYPEDSFEQILLKNAVSYSLWKSRFKRDMIIEKLIDMELREKITIDSNDIIEFYKTANPAGRDKTPENENDTSGSENEKELITQLRMKKTEEKYNEWIENLHKTYPVEINREKLKSFLIDTEEAG